MSSFLPDTSCMIAAVSGWHDHHVRAKNEIENRLDRDERLVVAAPALIESYSVLTRLPAPHRMTPSDALHLLDENFQKGIHVIAACAHKARVSALLTFNEKHFASLAGTGMEIIVP